MTPDKLGDYIDTVIGRLSEKMKSIIDIANMFAKDASYEMPKFFEPTIRRRRKEVFLEPIYESLKACTEAYRDLCNKTVEYSRQHQPSLPDVRAYLARESQNTFFLRNDVREKSSSWLNTLPKGSLERAFLWSCVKLLTHQSGFKSTTAELQTEADTLSDDVTNINLDTPTNYLLKAIEESATLDEAIIRIEQIRDHVLAHFKEATRCWEDLARDLNT